MAPSGETVAKTTEAYRKIGPLEGPPGGAPTYESVNCDYEGLHKT